MNTQKNACVIYVTATKGDLPAIQEELEKSEYTVCSVHATLEAAKAAQSGSENIPEAIKRCIERSNQCLFLIPENEDNDEGIGEAAGLAIQLGKRLVGLVAGSRTELPEGFDALGIIIGMRSPRVAAVIQGDDTSELEGKPARDRSIDHQKCQ